MAPSGPDVGFQAEGEAARAAELRLLPSAPLEGGLPLEAPPTAYMRSKWPHILTPRVAVSQGGVPGMRVRGAAREAREGVVHL